MSKASRESTAEDTYEYKAPADSQPVPEQPDRNTSPASFDVNSAADDAMPEEMPDLSGLATEPSVGALPDGWYEGEVVGGYETRTGGQLQTSDAPSKDGKSRNALFALFINDGAGGTRKSLYRVNYRVSDFSPEVQQAIKEARERFAGQKEWPGEAKQLHSRSITIGRIGQIEKAFGFKFPKRRDGLEPKGYVGQKADFRLTTNDNGFNEVVEIAKLGDRTKKVSKRNKR